MNNRIWLTEMNWRVNRWGINIKMWKWCGNLSAPTLILSPPLKRAVARPNSPQFHNKSKHKIHIYLLIIIIVNCNSDVFFLSNFGIELGLLRTFIDAFLEFSFSTPSYFIQCVVLVPINSALLYMWRTLLAFYFYLENKR